MKGLKYFDLVYEDFVKRAKWYYIHEMISDTELDAIMTLFSNVKREVECCCISQRQGVIRLSNVFREYFLF